MKTDRASYVRAILTNASSLAGTTLITALLGFVFWVLAARLFPPESVGYGSAAVSAMALLGTIGTLGLEIAVIGEVAERSDRPGALVAAALCASAVAGGLLAAGFMLVGTQVGHALAYPIRPELAALFITGVALTAASFVLDAAFVGALRGGMQLWRNVIFSAVKLVLLLIVGTAARTLGGVGVLTAWTAGIVISLLCVAVMLRVQRIPVLHTPRLGIVRHMLRRAAPHNWLNLALEAPSLLPPIIATTLVSATGGASFYAAWIMLSFLYIVPFHLGTVLYASGSARPSSLPDQLRFTLRLSLLAGLAGIPGLLIVGPWVLGLFGASYHDLGTAPLRLLALGYLPMIGVAHFVALCRIRRRIVLAASVLSIGTLIELGAAAIGAMAGGLIGLSVGVLIGKCLQGTLTARTVLRAASTSIMPHAIPNQRREVGGPISWRPARGEQRCDQELPKG